MLNGTVEDDESAATNLANAVNNVNITSAVNVNLKLLARRQL